MRVFFTPFNKQAMRFAYPGYDDEIRFVRDVLGHRRAGERIQRARRPMERARHVAYPAVGGRRRTSPRRDPRATRAGRPLAARGGFRPPRIAVAGLNPHAGDGGNFGREEIDVIEPAVRSARRPRASTCEGPFPSDTVFLRAKNGDFDAVLTMYHDQGQIAMKLMGFDRGVTLIGGLPFPICTPAHGTAYDIAGKGIANVGASRDALLLAIRMAAEAPARQRRSAAADTQRRRLG